MPQHAGTASRSVASTARDEDRDIPLYDQLKLTAALAACVSEYLQQVRNIQRLCNVAFHPSLQCTLAVFFKGV